jgi:hypothetical protein
VRAKYPKSISVGTWVKSYKTETEVMSECPGSSAVEESPEGKTLITWGIEAMTSANALRMSTNS